MEKEKALWIFELCDDSHGVVQVEREVIGDPRFSSKEVVIDLLRSYGEFYPVEDDPNYDGWLRLTVNIGPAEDPDEDEPHSIKNVLFDD